MKDELSSEIAALVAEQQRIRADRTIDRATKADLLGDLAAKIARLIETRNTRHAERALPPVARRLREW